MNGKRSRREEQLTLPGIAGPVSREPVSRRTFLTRTLEWVSAGIASVIGVPAVTAVVWPAFRKGQDVWSPIARLDDPAPDEPDLRIVGVPHLTSFRTIVADGYMEARPRDVAVFVVNEGDGKFTIYDVRCTHLGCPVSWEADSQRFYSPCHRGVFSIDGQVVSGPPPRPLDRYEVKIEDNVIYAGRLFSGGETA